MRIFACICGSPLFFDNTHCTNCGRTAGWCDVCDSVTGLDQVDGLFRCTVCATDLALCANYVEHNVCNRTVPAADVGSLCRCCEMNDMVPNLSVEGNAVRWARLEAAKRRLIYGLDRVALPYGPDTTPPLRFSFMGDGALAGLWREGEGAEKVFTGHDEGLVTINIAETDDAQREALRVDMGEAHRTLIGHFRHEIGHYYWDMLIRGQDEAGFTALFGDPQNPTYGEALERHYSEGAPAGWEQAHVSSYATMHPWEDWAETFALWLVMVSVLDTARSLGIMGTPVPDDAKGIVARYATLGLVLNELSREMGLLDYAPVVMSVPVEEKLAYIHRTMRAAANGPAPAFAE